MVKNKMKKIIIVLLSVLMLHSVLPIMHIQGEEVEDVQITTLDEQEDFLQEEIEINVVGEEELLLESDEEVINSEPKRTKGYMVALGRKNYTVKKDGVVLLENHSKSETFYDMEEGEFELSAIAPTGTHFVGWYQALLDKDNKVLGKGGDLVSSDNPYTFTLNSDVELFVRFDPDSTESVYFIYELNGGSMSTPSEFGMYKGTCATEPGEENNLRREGWLFCGWYADQALTIPFDFEQPIMKDTTVYAKWEQLVILQAYNRSLASVDSGGQVAYIDGENRGYNSNFHNVYFYNERRDITIIATPKQDYSFVEWTTTHGDFVSKQATYTLPSNGPTALFANFQKKPTVTFDSRGGTSVPTQVVDVGQKANKPDNPTQAGACTFIDWYTDEDLTNKFDFNTEIYNDITLYAKWSYYTRVRATGPGSAVINLGPNYNINGGYDEEYTQLTLVATPDSGKRFKHWIDKETNEVLSKDNPYTYVVTKEREIHAVFVDNNFTVTFDTRGGGTIDSQVILPGGKIERPSDPTKGDENVTFGYWQALGEEGEFSLASPVFDDFDLIAVWKIRTYLLPNAKDNDPRGYASFEDSSSDYRILEGSTKTITAYPNKGYAFKQWRILGVNGEVLSDENPYVYTGIDASTAINIYAIFVPEYTINFNYNGYTFDGESVYTLKMLTEENTTISEYIDEDTETSIAIRQHLYPRIKDGNDYYSVTDWYLDADCKNKFDVNKTNVTGSMTLYAGWSKVTNGDYILDETDVEQPMIALFYEGKRIKNGSVIEDFSMSGPTVTYDFEEEGSEKLKARVYEKLVELKKDATGFANDLGYKIVSEKTKENVVYDDDGMTTYLEYSHKDASGNYVYSNKEIERAIPNFVKGVQLKHGLRTKYTVVIVYGELEPIPTEEIILLKDTCYVEVGNSGLVANVIKVKPSNANTKEFTYTSSNTNAIKVDEQGRFGQYNALAAGTSIITIKSPNGITKTLKVIALDKMVFIDSIDLNKRTLELEINNSETLIATILPKDSTDNSVIWFSDDESIATVDQKGKVTAKKAGTTSINAYAVDGSYVMGFCEVTVIDSVKISSLKLDKTSLSLKVKDSETLKATITPTNTTNKTLKWTSSNTNIATVSSSGKITAKKDGTVIITATTTDGSNLSAKCSVTVHSLNTPKITFIRNTLEGVYFTFDKVDKATKYEIYRKDNKKNTSYSLYDTTTQLEYTDPNVTAGVTYYYQIKAVNKTASSDLSVFKKICYLSAPELTAITNTSKGVRLDYTKVEGSSWYRVYRRTADETEWTKMGQTTKLYYIDTQAKSGVTYYYLVRSVRGNYYSGVINSKYNKINYLATPELKTIKKVSNGIKLSYSKVNGASKYYIYRKDNKNNTSYTKIAETTSLTYTDKTAIKGVTYTYVIKARRGSYTSEKSNALKLAHK